MYYSRPMQHRTYNLQLARINMPFVEGMFVIYVQISCHALVDGLDKCCSYSSLKPPSCTVHHSFGFQLNYICTKCYLSWQIDMYILEIQRRGASGQIPKCCVTLNWPSVGSSTYPSLAVSDFHQSCLLNNLSGTPKPATAVAPPALKLWTPNWSTGYPKGCNRPSSNSRKHE